MSVSLQRFGWETERLGELLTLLASRSGLSSGGHLKNPPPSQHMVEVETAGLWIETASEWLDIEAQSSNTAYPEVLSMLRSAGPAVLRCMEDGRPVYLGLVKASRRGAVLLGQDGRSRRVAHEEVRRWLCSRCEGPMVKSVEATLDLAKVARRRRAKARSALMAQRLGALRLGGIWLLRPASGVEFRQQLNRNRVWGRLIALAVTHALQYALWILSWWAIGIAALAGRIDPGMVILWVLMVLSLVPFRMATTWLQASISIRAGATLKQRLLAGALRLRPEEIRHEGSGQLLARVLESEALESLALSGGFLVVLGAIELLMSLFVLASGAAGLLHAAALVGWLAIVWWFGRRYLEGRRDWTQERLGLTSSLVESMLGYRTRLAQDSSHRWHDFEDRQLEGYSQVSQGLDRRATVLGSFLTRGWVLLGVAALGPALFGGKASAAGVAIALGGVLLSYRSLAGFVSGLTQVYGASIAWRQTRDLFDAASRSQPLSEPDLVVARKHAEGRAVLEAQEIDYSYEGRAEPVVKKASLQIHRGDRILLQGPSGTGKSTLASLLAGIREPSSGLLLLRGLDQSSAGTRFWRQSVVLAPQFHENHILNESLAFNILMGRHWPPRQEHLDEAEEICRRLGLGDLLDRMPSGLFQMVGETGWQLSHGERSRIYIARTLMQEHDVTILDETFGGLDGESVLESAEVLLERASTVAVIGHG